MFNDAVWWVTGASSGIGAALAQALSAAGGHVILSGRNLPALQDVAGRCRNETLILPFEAADFAALPQQVEAAWGWKGRLNGLVNNAGISQRSLAAQTAFEVYEKIVAVDLLAPIALTQLVLPRMIAGGGGRIVAISSIAGLVGVPLRSAYCAAKHGIVGYHDSVRAETAGQGIGVLVVCPGSVRTNVSRNALDASGAKRGESDAAIDNGLDPADVALRVLEALGAGVRELIIASPNEASLPQLRRTQPDACFDLMAQMVASGYAQQMGAERG